MAKTKANKKVVKVKPKAKTKRVSVTMDEGKRTMTTKEFKEWTDALKNIGSRKKGGFVIIGKVISEKNDNIEMKTIGFINKLPLLIVIKDTLASLGIDL